MAELEKKESHDIPASISEKIQKRQMEIMEAQQKLDKEREHLNDVFETASELLGIEAPPERVQFDAENNQLIELGVKTTEEDPETDKKSETLEASDKETEGKSEKEDEEASRENEASRSAKSKE